MRDLGKWPRVLVAGTPVSAEQADEILIRTAQWYLCTNDYDFEMIVAEVAGISIGRHGRVDLDSVRRFEASRNVLGLNYLHNAQIASAWIGGPHGWCDWDGNIGASTWNIGKWPSVETVTEDWETIAAAFPYLDLTAQLVGNEGEDTAPAAQWRVQAGAVRFEPDPVEMLRPVEELDPMEVVQAISHGRFRERGVTRERLELALARTRSTSSDTTPDTTGGQ